MSRVNVDFMVQVDGRFDDLARKAGLADRDHAVGIMVKVWAQCTARESETLKKADVDCAYLKSKQCFSEIVISADLGVDLGDSIRIRGCTGRTDWLKNKRAAGKKGGKASSRKGISNKGLRRSKQSKQRLPKKVSRAPEKSNTLAPAPAPAPVLNKERGSSNKSTTDNPGCLKLSTQLASLVAARDPGSKAAKEPTTTARRWYIEIERLHRIDGRSCEDIRRVIEWSQADPFWQANILSGKKLRRQFETLWAQLSKPSKSNGSAPYVVGGGDLKVFNIEDYPR